MEKGKHICVISILLPSVLAIYWTFLHSFNIFDIVKAAAENSRNFTLCKEVAAFQHEMEACYAEFPATTQKAFEKMENESKIFIKVVKQFEKKQNARLEKENSS